MVYFVIAGSKPFHLAHVEFRSTVVAVERGRPVVAGTALIARFTSNSEADALMFTEDPQTQNIVTVDGKLCVTDDDNGVHNLVSNRPMERRSNFQADGCPTPKPVSCIF